MVLNKNNKNKKITAVYSAAVIFILCSIGLICNAPLFANGEEANDITLQVVVPDGADYVVVDVLDGVEARYRTMTYGDIYGEYSCAGYIKAYYQAVYGVAVQNLTDEGPPHPEALFMQVSVPQKGDIIFNPSPPNRNNHSAIVKSFDGNRIVLIEQNYKWAQADGTYTYVNRTIPWPSDNDQPYQIWRLKDAKLEEPSIAQPFDQPAESPMNQPDEPPIDQPAEPPMDQPDEPPMDQSAELPDGQPEQNGLDMPSIEAAPEVEPDLSFKFEAVVTVGRMAITVNGLDMPVSAPAFIENNRTLMPVRGVCYAFGIMPDDLLWDEDNRMVVIYNNNGSSRDEIIFTIGSELLFVNGLPVVMDCPAMIRFDSAYLPVKYLADVLGISYTWDVDTASAVFTR